MQIGPVVLEIGLLIILCFTPYCQYIPAILRRWLLKRKFIKLRQCIFSIWLLSRLGKGLALHLYEIESPSAKEALR